MPTFWANWKEHQADVIKLWLEEQYEVDILTLTPFDIGLDDTDLNMRGAVFIPATACPSSDGEPEIGFVDVWISDRKYISRNAKTLPIWSLFYSVVLQFYSAESGSPVQPPEEWQAIVRKMVTTIISEMFDVLVTRRRKDLKQILSYWPDIIVAAMVSEALKKNIGETFWIQTQSGETTFEKYLGDWHSLDESENVDMFAMTIHRSPSQYPASLFEPDVVIDATEPAIFLRLLFESQATRDRRVDIIDTHDDSLLADDVLIKSQHMLLKEVWHSNLLGFIELEFGDFSHTPAVIGISQETTTALRGNATKLITHLKHERHELFVGGWEFFKDYYLAVKEAPGKFILNVKHPIITKLSNLPQTSLALEIGLQGLYYRTYYLQTVDSQLRKRHETEVWSDVEEQIDSIIRLERRVIGLKARVGNLSRQRDELEARLKAQVDERTVAKLEKAIQSKEEKIIHLMSELRDKTEAFQNALEENERLDVRYADLARQIRHGHTKLVVETRSDRNIP